MVGLPLLFLVSGFAVDVGPGVTFELEDRNSSITFAESIEVDSVSVSSSYLSLNGNNFTVYTGNSQEVQTDLFSYNDTDQPDQTVINLSTSAPAGEEVNYELDVIEELEYSVVRDGSVQDSVSVGSGESPLEWNYTSDGGFTDYSILSEPGDVTATVLQGDNDNLNPGPADNGEQTIDIRLEQEYGNTIDGINISNGTDVIASESDVSSGETVSFNIIDNWGGSIQEDQSYTWEADIIFRGAVQKEINGTFTTFTNYMSWDPSDDQYEESYRVYYSKDGGEFDYGNNTYTQIVSTEETEFVDANPSIESGQNCYRAVSVNLAGESAPVGECINVN